MSNNQSVINTQDNENNIKQINNNTDKISNNTMNKIQKDNKRYTPAISERFNIKSLGISPIMINWSKLAAAIRSNIEITPENSFQLIGEYANRYATVISGTNQSKLQGNLDRIQLNNNITDLLDFIKLFANNNANILSPRAFINCINTIGLYYIKSNKIQILKHLAYLAEIMYLHLSSLIDDTQLTRDDFFESDNGLNVYAVNECAEFYYTDIYLLNSDEKTELMNTLETYYLNDILKIKKQSNNTLERVKASKKKMTNNTEAERIKLANERAKAKKTKEANKEAKAKERKETRQAVRNQVAKDTSNNKK